MFLVTIRMKAISAKRMELLQIIATLVISIRMDKGCTRCDVCQSLEDENEILLFEEWVAQENVRSHLKSGRFRVLRWMTDLFREPCEMLFYTTIRPTGMEEI
jgi:quinol monooxygenase YgiN